MAQSNSNISRKRKLADFEQVQATKQPRSKATGYETECVQNSTMFAKRRRTVKNVQSSEDESVASRYPAKNTQDGGYKTQTNAQARGRSQRKYKLTSSDDEQDVNAKKYADTKRTERGQASPKKQSRVYTA